VYLRREREHSDGGMEGEHFHLFLSQWVAPEGFPPRTEEDVTGIPRRRMPQCPCRLVIRVLPASGGSAAMLRIADAIRRTQTEDGGILLDIHHGQMFCLNVVGSKIIELLERGFDETQIAEQVSGMFAADIETVRADVHDFIEVLNKHHILQMRDARGIT